MIAGAGPVGMCVALEAARRGVEVVLIEPRSPAEPPSAKCNTVAARTLETFRRFGLADAVRGAGLPDDYPTDVIYAAHLAGNEFTRITMPSRAERHSDGFPDSHWLTPEPVVRVNQIYLEPILFEAVRAQPGISVFNRARVESFDQTADGVVVHCLNVDQSGHGETFDVHGRFLVGCDGGASTIRRSIGARLEGDAELGHTRSTLIRSSQVRALFGERRPAWVSWILNEKVRGAVVAIDGDELWLLHRGMPLVGDADDAHLHQTILDLLGVDTLDYEVVNHEDWTGRRLVADKFRDRNVFLAGDAAHLWVPFAGYGMNAGIADGVSLAWMLSAVIQGWASPDILDAYQAERHPITEQASRLAMSVALGNALALSHGELPPLLEDPGPEGDNARASLGEVLREANLAQFAPQGLNFGYFYDASPIIAYDGATPPPYTLSDVEPSTVPGCRMPHFMVEGRPILDLLAADYTLLRFDTQVDVQPLLDAAGAVGLPLTVLDMAPVTEPPVFEHDLLMVRFDQHIVWRGDTVPTHPEHLVATLRGLPVSPQDSSPSTHETSLSGDTKDVHHAHP